MATMQSEAAALAAKRNRVTVSMAQNNLSEFDKHREPRPLIEGKSSTTVQMRAFNKDVQCPVCWGIIRDTRAVMVCMHRFCRECIERSLQLGKRECPQCRAFVTSRRSLRPDKNFDSLIAQIYPNLEEVEEKQVELAAEITQKVDLHTLVGDNVAAGMERQAKAKRIPKPQSRDDKRRKIELMWQKSKKEYDTASQHSAVSRSASHHASMSMPSSTPAAGAQTHTQTAGDSYVSLSQSHSSELSSMGVEKQSIVKPQEVWFNLVKDDRSISGIGKDIPYERSYLRTCGFTRVGDVIQYLAGQIGVDAAFLEIIVDVDGLLIPMSPSISLIALIQNYWTRRQDLVLKYRIFSQ